MRTAQMMVAAVLGLVCLPLLHAQDASKDATKKSETESTAASEVPLKVQVIVSEFDGNQKIGSLPYTIRTVATDFKNRRREYLRFGVRIPVSVSSGQFQYQDVGTDIDCQAFTRDNDQYYLDINIERTSVMAASAGKETDWKPAEANPGMQPLLRRFQDEFALVMRDGQSMEGVSAVDPATGHVLKVDVTLNVVK